MAAVNQPQQHDCFGDKQEPLAPFQESEPFELAALAVLLSKGKDPAKCLPAAASLWAQAYQYREHLRHLFWGPEHDKIAALHRPVLSIGAGDYVTVKEACAKYSWGEKHLRAVLKDNVPLYIFEQLWKPPVKTIKLPKTLLERLDKLQAQKRAARARKAVKS
jgi:hypothetical protein